ncbi:MAG: peptide chain release factor 1 [Candidatus Omnitrophota bacterium]
MLNKLEKLEARYRDIEELLSNPEILAETEKYNKLVKEFSDLKEPVGLFREYKKAKKEEDDLKLMLKQKHNAEFVELAEGEIQDLIDKKNALLEKVKQALTQEDKDANKDVIVEVRQGTGGQEAALFAGDLYRMYTKYAATKNWSVELMSSHPTDVGGFKEIIFSIKGKGAFRILQFETGVHRVQRVPATEAQGRIHTSTATVAALIEPEEVDLDINSSDLRIDTYRSSGPGGQHMQKCDSAVRITYIPTSTVVACQDERSQLKNKNKAMRILRAKLLDVKRQEEFKKLGDARRSQIGSGDRSEKIRTYNFPDRRVTDHRINFTSYRLEAILEGELGEFSDALIKAADEKKNLSHKDE